MTLPKADELRRRIFLTRRPQYDLGGIMDAQRSVLGEITSVGANVRDIETEIGLLESRLGAVREDSSDHVRLKKDELRRAELRSGLEKVRSAHWLGRNFLKLVEFMAEQCGALPKEDVRPVTDIQRELNDLQARADRDIQKLEHQIQSYRAQLKEPLSRMASLTQRRAAIERVIPKILERLEEGLDTAVQLCFYSPHRELKDLILSYLAPRFREEFDRADPNMRDVSTQVSPGAAELYRIVAQKLQLMHERRAHVLAQRAELIGGADEALYQAEKAADEAQNYVLGALERIEEDRASVPPEDEETERIPASREGPKPSPPNPREEVPVSEGLAEPTPHRVGPLDAPPVPTRLKPRRRVPAPAPAQVQVGSVEGPSSLRRSDPIRLPSKQPSGPPVYQPSGVRRLPATDGEGEVPVHSSGRSTEVFDLTDDDGLDSLGEPVSELRDANTYMSLPTSIHQLLAHILGMDITDPSSLPPKDELVAMASESGLDLKGLGWVPGLTRVAEHYGMDAKYYNFQSGDDAKLGLFSRHLRGAVDERLSVPGLSAFSSAEDFDEAVSEVPAPDGAATGEIELSLDVSVPLDVGQLLLIVLDMDGPASRYVRSKPSQLRERVLKEGGLDLSDKVSWEDVFRAVATHYGLPDSDYDYEGPAENLTPLVEAIHSEVAKRRAAGIQGITTAASAAKFAEAAAQYGFEPSWDPQRIARHMEATSEA